MRNCNLVSRMINGVFHGTVVFSDGSSLEFYSRKKFNNYIEVN